LPEWDLRLTPGAKSMTDLNQLMGVPPALEAAIVRRGFSTLTQVQKEVLKLNSEGKNLRITSQTGSGKTLAMGLVLGQELEEDPRSHPKGPRALIVAPTRELAAQIQSELKWLYEDLSQLRVAVVTGGTDIGRERKVLARRPQILVGTPGRLLDHSRNRALNLSEIQHVVLDEADQMLDMGFKDELDAIVELLPKERRSHLISATFPREVKALADRFQPDAVIVEGTKLGLANPDIEHVAYRVRSRERYGALVNSLLLAEGERCLIFVRRRMDASELAEMLAGDGFSAMPFSGDLSQAQRSRTLHAFRKGVVNTLVATDVAARGIDVADISSVIHRDLPSDSDTYTHRSGRTGRAGNKGRSVLLVPPAGERRIRRLLSDAKIEASWQSVPTPKKIEKTMVKRARRKVHAIMKTLPSFGETEREYAQSLLSEYDAETLVAQLLELAVPTLPRNPLDVASIEEGRGARGRPNDRKERDSDGRRGPPRKNVRKGNNGSDTYVRFGVNTGRTEGATPQRLLAMICRRGNISGRFVGAMKINETSTSFDVSTEIAKDFESSSAQKDSRDPHLNIYREGHDKGHSADSKPRDDRESGPGDSRNHGKPERYRKIRDDNARPRRDKSRSKKKKGFAASKGKPKSKKKDRTRRA
jgi:ATP-dependent RNA helicase DeaD